MGYIILEVKLNIFRVFMMLISEMRARDESEYSNWTLVIEVHQLLDAHFL